MLNLHTCKHFSLFTWSTFGLNNVRCSHNRIWYIVRENVCFEHLWKCWQSCTSQCESSGPPPLAESGDSETSTLTTNLHPPHSFHSHNLLLNRTYPKGHIYTIYNVKLTYVKWSPWSGLWGPCQNPMGCTRDPWGFALTGALEKVPWRSAWTMIRPDLINLFLRSFPDPFQRAECNNCKK